MKKLVVITILLFLVQQSLPACCKIESCKRDSVDNPWKHFSHRPKANKARPAFSPWEYMKKEEQYITAKAGLTLIEAESVFPLLHQMKERQREIDGKIFRLFNQANFMALSEAESKSIIEDIERLNKEKQTIETTYNHKMLSILSAKKFLKFKQAEMNFGRFMLHKMFMDKNKNCRQAPAPKQGGKK